MSETATKSTGPRTEEGKSISSQNARKTGLFTTRDFIRPEEQNEYDELSESLASDLNPEGPLEIQIANEIRTAIWRLRRCTRLEADLAGSHDPQDPMDPASPQAKQQLSIDRARNQATRLLHKNTAELRRLQTERQFRDEIRADGISTENLGLCDFHTAISHADRAVKNAERRSYNQFKNQLDTMQMEDRWRNAQAPVEPATAELTKRTPLPAGHAASVASSSPEIARNAPCPCNSGEKYKRCCGRQAPPVLTKMKFAA